MSDSFRRQGQSRSGPRRRSALVAAALALPATQAAAATELLGGGYLVAHDSCAAHGWRGTHQVLARLAPQGAPGNPRTESQMALILATGAISFRFDNSGSYRFTHRLSAATYVWNGPWSPQSPTMTFSWNLYGDIPQPRAAALPELIIDFDNFNEHPGCRVTAYLALRRN